MREDKGGGVVVNRFYYYFQYRVNSARWISVIFRGFFSTFLKEAFLSIKGEYFLIR